MALNVEELIEAWNAGSTVETLVIDMLREQAAEIKRLRGLLGDVWRMWAKEDQDGDNVLADCGERIKAALGDEQSASAASEK